MQEEQDNYNSNYQTIEQLRANIETLETTIKSKNMIIQKLVTIVI